MSVARSKLQWLYQELGVAAVYHTGRNAWLIILSRSCRMVAYGAASVFMALFFAVLEFSDFRIGLFMTMTLLGDVVLTLLLTLLADSFGRRRILLLGSAMMIASGTVFYLFENFWILLIAAVVGIISASGGDFGPFRAIEESILSQLTTSQTRNNVLSWYVTLASLGSAIGTESAGIGVSWLKDLDGWDDVRAYHTVFGLYVICGVVNACCVLALTEDTETQAQRGVEPDGAEEQILLRDRDEGLEGGDSQGESGKLPLSTDPSIKASRLARLSPDTRKVMFKLWPLLSVDTIADGMVNNSLTTYYMATKFTVSASALGSIMSVSYILATVSTVFAGPLANRLGLINTMVFTHIPSSAAVLLFPLPTSLFMTVILFFIRTGLNNMDQAPRAAFIAAVVPAEERTAVNGMTSTIRTLSATFGPTLTGSLAESHHFWIAFVTAGVLRLMYDFGLWALFVDMEIVH